MNFNRWVSENNVSPELSYSKGWWDTIQFFQMIEQRFKPITVEVIDTYNMKTPPPEEELLMPIIKLTKNDVEVFLKTEFAPLPPYWTASVIRNKYDSNEKFHCIFDYSNYKVPFSKSFGEKYDFKPYWQDFKKFTCRLEDEYDVYMFLRIVFTLPIPDYD